jgi:L-iditol 2-dehydrogenase
MKAVVKYASGPKKVELRDVPEPTTGKGEVKIKIEYVGICGTDLHIYHDHYQYQPPVVMGHEFSGSVVEIGEGVESLRLGDRVTSEPFASVCGTCLNCRTGNPNLCLKRLSAGSGLNGGMTEFCVMPEERVHILPPEVGFKEGALSEPLACCVHGVIDTNSIKPGDLVIVSGPGVIGLLSLQLAKISGAKVVLLGTSNDRQRLKIGSELGADYIFDSYPEMSEFVKELTNGFGADVIIESAGHEKSFDQALDVVRKGGTILQMGLFGETIKIAFDRVVMKEIAVLGTFASNWSSWNRALRLLAQKQVKVDLLVDCALPLESWAEAFKRTENREALKVLLKP